MRLKWAVLTTSIAAVGLVALLIALTGLVETAGENASSVLLRGSSASRDRDPSDAGAAVG